MKQKKQVVWTRIIIRKDRDLDELLSDLLHGIDLAVQFFRGMSQWLDMAAKAKDKPPLCLACDFEFKPGIGMPRAFALAYSLDPAGEHVILTGICDGCLQKGDAELLNVASAGLCKVLDGKPLGFNSPMPERMQ